MCIFILTEFNTIELKWSSDNNNSQLFARLYVIRIVERVLTVFWLWEFSTFSTSMFGALFLYNIKDSNKSLALRKLILFRLVFVTTLLPLPTKKSSGRRIVTYLFVIHKRIHNRNLNERIREHVWCVAVWHVMTWIM